MGVGGGEFVRSDDLAGELIAVFVVAFPTIGILGGTEEIISRIPVYASYLQHQRTRTVAFIAVHRFSLHIGGVFDNAGVH